MRIVLVVTSDIQLAARLAAKHHDRFRVVSYLELRMLCTALARQIFEAYVGGPGIVICPVLMGGGIPARLVTDALLGSGLVSDIVPCRIKRYSGVGEAGEAEFTLPLDPKRVKGRIVIGIDDLVDGGQTLEAFTRHANEFGSLEVQTAVIFAKPGSTHQPKFVAEAGVTQWLVMPGEEMDFMQEIVGIDTEVGEMKPSAQAAYFVGLGLDAAVVRDWQEDAARCPRI